MITDSKETIISDNTSTPQDTSDNVSAPLDTSENISAPQDTSDNVGAPQDTSDNVGAPQDTSDNVGAPQDTSDNVSSLQDMTNADRFELAYDIICFLSDAQDSGSDLLELAPTLKREFPQLSDFDTSRFSSFFSQIKSPNLNARNNFFCAYTLFYILTGGQYPQDCWQGYVDKYIQVKKLEESADRKEKDLIKKLLLNNEKNAISQFVEGVEIIGYVKTFEILWEVLGQYYRLYKPSNLKKIISEFHSQKNIVREKCFFKTETEQLQLFAISCMGKQSKPMHVECEDACKVAFFDEAKTSWLAVSADGVGSALYSSIGSICAANALETVIGRQLSQSKSTPQNNGVYIYADSQQTDQWQEMKHYFQSTFVTDLYNEWIRQLEAQKEQLPSDFEFDPSAFGTTLQFAFGCADFIACGRLGDGRYFIRNRDEHDAALPTSGELLTDGVSGVTQEVVFTPAHLKENPNYLKISFYSPNDLTDIIISSDGLNRAIGDTVRDADQFVTAIDKLPFDEKCQKLEKIVYSCSEYNKTYHGSGDDSTIVYVHLKHTPDDVPKSKN